MSWGLKSTLPIYTPLKPRSLTGVLAFCIVYNLCPSVFGETACLCYNVGMKITKLEHSGIVIEKDGKLLVFDPVEFTEKLPELKNVVAIIITHKHSDHLQPEILTKILGDNPEAKILTTGDTSALVENAIVMKSGGHYEIGGFSLDFFGGNHAAIIPEQIPCENIGVVVDGAIVNPGDSFDLPDVRAKVLFVPIAAPWLKIVESMAFIEKIKPEIAIPVHDALLSELGEAISNNWVRKACDDVMANLTELKPGESIEF